MNRIVSWCVMCLVSVPLFCVHLWAGEQEYALSVAAMEENLDKVKELLQKGADPNFQNSRGNAVLIEVARAGFTPVAKLLLDHGAKVNLQDKRGMSALMEAAAKGNLDLTKILLEKGADLNLKSATGATALLHATTGGHAQVAEYLKSKGAK
jgi:uncharacterized protein